jgi:hypothetical protein
LIQGKLAAMRDNVVLGDQRLQAGARLVPMDDLDEAVANERSLWQRRTEVQQTRIENLESRVAALTAALETLTDQFGMVEKVKKLRWV